MPTQRKNKANPSKSNLVGLPSKPGEEKPNDERIDITLEIARGFLAVNHPRNRKARSGRIEQYAKAMALGKWLDTGEPYQFDTRGRMINGQTRCRAAIKANYTIKNALIVRNVSEEAIQVMDQGQPRSVQQALYMEGKNVTALEIAIARALCWNVDTLSRSENIGRDAVREIYLKHREAVRFAATLDGKVKGQCVNFAAIRVILARAYYHVDLEALARFRKTLDTGFQEELRDRNAVMLRNLYLALNNSNKSNRHLRQDLFSKAISAMKSFELNEVPDRLVRAKEQIYFLPEEQDDNEDDRYYQEDEY